MSPIDRLASRTQAFQVLGVSGSPTKSDIRKAYRNLAFEKHPDQHPECGAEFSRITEAYRYICEHADELGITDAPDPEEVSNVSAAPRRVSRPTITPTEQEFDAKIMSECEAYLEECEFDGAAHIASAVYRKGRNLTYYVKTPVTKGKNAVVLPTGMLVDSRKTLPRLVVFDHSDAQTGFFEMPSETCEEHFPGARQIQVRFASA
ncbi:MAG: DnaJ domain-containing protein [Pseudomonadota bacterium]